MDQPLIDTDLCLPKPRLELLLGGDLDEDLAAQSVLDSIRHEELHVMTLIHMYTWKHGKSTGGNGVGKGRKCTEEWASKGQEKQS